MTNQQKIEFYLSKGFAVEVEWEKSGKAKLFDSDKFGNFVGMKKGECDSWDNIAVNQAIKLTPIPPKPYEFKVGDKVILLTTKSQEVGKVIGEKSFAGVYKIDQTTSPFVEEYYPWYQLAPALPEDEECENVFDRLATSRQEYDKVCNSLCIVLMDKYKLSAQDWNEDIAPVLRTFLPSISN